jgi:CCR4-NOT transcriptional complex subunit CAF120
MVLKDGKKLDNILSVSTAASNKYLFHFDSYHALTQWTAGIRLAMYEHTSLSEAYTGALIAGKGKTLNNIRALLDRQCAVYDDWVRVRFGAGTPWRRCWCVVSPPDQKEYAKLQKSQKKTDVYNRPTVLKGDIKFYDTRKIKKTTKPIATVRDAFSCYAIYPQSKPLIDQSTLVKIEGKITIHSNPESTTEGFVFVMPEARPAITGFEIMLQYLFPVFDTFNLYGRPKKLVADVLDTRGLMFGMPPDRRYGYLEIWDIVGLINTDGSSNWSERTWRKQLKDLTSTRMQAGMDGEIDSTRSSRRNTVNRAGFGQSRASSLRFDDQGSVRSNPSTRRPSPTGQPRFDLDPQGPRRVGTAPPTGPYPPPRHQRSASDNNAYSKYQTPPSRRAQAMDGGELPPTPPPHAMYNGAPLNGQAQYHEAYDSDESPNRERDLPQMPLAPSAPPSGPVDAPPALGHAPYQQPPIRPSLPSDMMPNATVDPATYQQMADANHATLPAGIAATGAAAAWRNQDSIQSRRSGDYNAYGDNSEQMYLSAPSRPPPTDRNSGSRLPTIPASPYVEHAEFVQSAMYQPVAPPVPEHAEYPQQQWSQDVPFRPQSGSGGQLQRKPVPGRSPSAASKEDDVRSTTSSSLNSLRNDVIDPEALDALNHNESMLFRQHSKSSSYYDDDAISTSTPDYASIASEDIQPRKLPVRPEDRPRSGILKVAGDPNLKSQLDIEDEVHHMATQPLPASVPSFDFGPTFSLPLVAKRPGTSGTMTQALQDKSFSQSMENHAIAPPEQRRQSHISGGSSPEEMQSQSFGQMRGGSGSPNASYSRSVAWQPISPASQQQQPDRQKLDADEWVKNRASQSSQTLMYGQGRTTSRTPPPLGGRQRSGDWSHMQRTPEAPSGAPRFSGRPLSRPQSRGAEAILEHRPTNLSAVEQERVARLTNTTLLNGVHGHKKQQPSQGLTGYIDYREKEKAAAKATRHSHSPAVQAEIDRRNAQTQQKQIAEARERQRQMLEMQQQQMQIVAQQNAYMYGGEQYHARTPSGTQSVMGVPMGAPSVMGMSMGTPSVMGMSMGTPSVMGMPTGPGTPQGIVGMTYPSPQGMYQPQGYFSQPAMTPNTNMMPGGWGSPTPQTPQSQYFQPQQMGYGQQQQPPAQAYGASFDQARAAARHAQQQHEYRR